MATLTLAGAAPVVATPIDVSGLWMSVSDHQGQELTLRLTVKAGQVTGTAEGKSGTLAARQYVVTGRYLPPSIELTLTGAGAPPSTLRATLTGPETLKGQWSGSPGVVQDLTFVRP